jgi:hypothetical protein
MSAASDNMIISRAKAIAAMGLVERDFDGFSVRSPNMKKETFKIWRDENGRVCCNCAEFEARSVEDARFRCEHILAVKFHLEPPADAVDSEIVSESNEQDEAENFSASQVNGQSRTTNFSMILRELSDSVSPEMIRQRIGWRDSAGREHEVDYVEWHTVADLLDRVCPDWSHQVTQVKQIGDFVAVTASITIQGVTRQGVGTGSAYDEKGIKKAEHDALKRAAVKFGLARDLYRKEDEMKVNKNFDGVSPIRPEILKEPTAKTMADLVTPKQLVAIRAISHSQRVNAEAECFEVMGCKPEELSRRAASAFIDHLKSKNADPEIRQVG